MSESGLGAARHQPSDEPRSQIIVVAEADIAAGDGSPQAEEPDPIASTLAAAGAEIQPLFGPQARLRSQASVAEAAALANYYVAEVAPDSAEDLAARLRDLDGIDGAYMAPRPEPAIDLEVLQSMTRDEAAPPAATPSFRSRQIYLGPAPAGIDARYAWTLSGGKGAGVRVIDIEGAWRFDHEDLLENQGGTVGTPSSDLGWRNHGTAVVGVIGGDDGPFGVTGISPEATCRGFSIFGYTGVAARAIKQAADALGPGDIILIELHAPGPGASGSGQDGFIAMEWWPAEFDAIAYATAKGVVVVEAAGNGSRDLDNRIYDTPEAGFPASWRNPFKRTNRDSGAIVAGAGAPPPGTHGIDHGPDRSRLAFSNWGALVDAQGWGREVTTTGYGDLQGGSNETLWYTDRFSGTSSASPIVVGTCACVQGVRLAEGRNALTPAEMRAALRGSGSPQRDAQGRPATQRIGTRPNLRELLSTTDDTQGWREFADRVEGLERRVEHLEQSTGGAPPNQMIK